MTPSGDEPGQVSSVPQGQGTPRPGPGPATLSSIGGLSFLDRARSESDQLRSDLRKWAGGVLATQGRLRELLHANAVVPADLDLPVVLQQIVDAARDLIDARYGALSLIGADGLLQEFVHAGGADEELAGRIGELPQGRGLLGRLTDQPGPIRLADLAGESDVTALAPGQPPVRGFLGVRITTGDTVLGGLYFTDPNSGGQFTAEDEELAIALAAAAGGAIANVRLFTESEQLRRWLTATGELARRLLAADATQPFQPIADEAMSAAGADFAALALLHGADQIIIAAAAGCLAVELQDRIAPMGNSRSGRVIRTGEAALVAEGDTDVASVADDFDRGPMMVLPLAGRGRVRGALTLGRLTGRPAFTEANLAMAAVFAHQAALALELADARAEQAALVVLEDHDRIARDLHDHVIQELFATGTGMQRLAAVTTAPAQAEQINAYVDSLDHIADRIRTSIYQLQLHQYDSADVRAGLLGVVEQHAPQLGFTAHVRFAGPLALSVDPALTEDILAVTREALSNSARHAHATTIDIYLRLEQNLLTLQITDDGVGIGTPTRSSGLTNMRQRALHKDGTLQLTTPAGGGTRITWTAHLPQPPAS